MGIREKLNQSPAVSVGIVSAVIVVAGVFIVTQARQNAAPRYGTKAYFSDDDGKSYYEDSSKLIAPYDHGGRQAYRAYVFKCVDDGKEWVGYLEGYRPDAKTKVEEIQAMTEKLAADPKAAPPPRDRDPVYLLPPIQRTGLIVKQPDKPGQPSNKWVCEADGAAYGNTREAVCPHGGKHPVMAVLP